MAATPSPRRDRSEAEDHISRLPEVLLSDILSRLGTGEAARTVVLSTRFRDAWLATPLRLDDLEFSAPSRGRGPSIAPWTARADALTRALASHPGPVALFRLSRTTFRGCVPAAEAWFRELAAKGVREVSLCCSPEWCHEALADPLLGCRTLKTLALGKCRLSDAGASFSSAAAACLTELTLSETVLSEATLQSILSGCPKLRSVVLKHVQGPSHIRVRSCRSLVLLGVWHYKQLEEITVDAAPCLERLLGNWRRTVGITVLGAPRLIVLGYVMISFQNFLPSEPAQELGKCLSAPIHSVKILAIIVKFSSKEDMQKAIGLLDYFPCLETLHVQSSDTKYDMFKNDTVGGSYYQHIDPIKYVVSHLKSVRLEGKCVNNIMLEFARFLLATAHVLQIMRIQSEMPGFPEWVTHQEDLLSESHIASLEAKVVFEGVKCREAFTIEAVNALYDPFDGNINIAGY